MPGDPATTCRPLAIDVYTVAPELLAGWKPTKAADYAGVHGLVYPERGPRAAVLRGPAMSTHSES